MSSSLSSRVIVIAIVAMFIAISAAYVIKASRNDGEGLDPNIQAAEASPERLVTEPARPFRPAHTVSVERTPMSPQALQQAMRERASDLDQNLREDPRDPAWATSKENEIHQVIAGLDAADHQNYGISASEVECHSHSCMIAITTPGDDEADMAAMTIRRALSSDFNETLTVPIRGEDGQVQYRMYSVADGYASLLRKRRPESPPVSPDRVR